MPRKGSVPKRDVLPDPIHNSKLVTKLINKIMLDGKRGTAQRILYSAFDLVEQRSGRDALEVFEEAINNIMPVLEVKARRVVVLTTKYQLRCAQNVVLLLDYVG